MRWDIGPGYVPRILAGSGQSSHGRDGAQARSFAVTEVAAMVKRIALFTYGVVSYFIFLGTFLYAVGFIGGFAVPTRLDGDRKSTRLNSSHANISYAVFCLEKKKIIKK